MFRTNYWLISLIAALIGYISVVLPSWWGTDGGKIINIWYFGMYTDGSSWRNLGEEPLLIPGIITMILLLVGATLILFSALSAKKKGDNKSMFSLIGGIVNIVASIFFIIGLTLVDNEIWLNFSAGVGLILPFISGALAIICWYSLKRA